MAESFAPLSAPLDDVAATDRRRQAIVGVGVFVFLTAAGAAHGGYFEGSWGWLTLASAWAAVMALVFDARAGVTRTGTAFVGLLGAYTLWSLISAWWSVDVTSTVLEAQRNLVYVAAVGAVLLLARDALLTVVTAVWASGVGLCGYALLTRLVPDRFGSFDPISGYRLSEPIGYWNSLGMLAAVGALLGLALSARGGRWLRVLGAASVPVFTTTLYFTFSRGAWGSLFVGVVVLLALDPRRLQAGWWLVLGAISSGLALLLAARQHGLTTTGTALTIQTHEGHRLLLELLVVVVASGVAALGWVAVERVIETRGAGYQRRVEFGVVVLIVIAAIGFFAVKGTPWHLAQHTWDNFQSTPVASGSDLNGRLFHLSGTGRVAQWRIAWHEGTAHPMVGTGAATWEHYWNLHRPSRGTVINVHNLYLEAFATLGIVGLVLLVAALAAAAAAIARLRRQPLVPFAGALFAAYLVHAVVDWDWQVTAVTLPVLLCVGAVCAGGEPLVGRARACAYAAAGVVAVIGIWAIGTQTTLSKIHDAKSAQRASDLEPWSTEPWRRLAELDINQTRYADAQTALHTALAMDNSNWQLWFDLARATDDVTRIRALARAQVLNPRSREVANLKATIASLSAIGTAK